MKEARSGGDDLVEENMDGVWTHISRACEKGIRMKMPSTRMTTASVLVSRGVVGTTGRGPDWEVQYLSFWMTSGTLSHFCVGTRSRGSTQRCSFGHKRFPETTEKLHVQTRESTDDTFAAVLGKMGLEKISRGHIKGNTYKGEVLEVGYLEKDGEFVILHQV